MKNKELERELWLIDGMANALLKQTKDVMGEISKLKKYSIEDLEKSSEKLLEISKKICEVKKNISRKGMKHKCM